MPTFRLRPFDYTTDCPALVAAHHAEGETQITEESLHRDENQRLQDGILNQQMVALNEEGSPIGFSYVGRALWAAPERFRLSIVVQQAYRQEGAGNLLLQAAHDWARTQPAQYLYAGVRDDDPTSYDFATKRGFVMERQRFVSQLEIADFDAAPFAGILEAKEKEGFRFASLAELGDTEEYRQKLYDINMLAVRDEPAFDGTVPPYEEFAHMVFDAWWFRADGQFLVLDGDNAVGVAAVGYDKAQNRMFNAFTGTHPDYRGRGLALALKLLTIRLACNEGIASIRTNNDSLNPAMLAVNQKLGYVRQPGRYQMRYNLI